MSLLTISQRVAAIVSIKKPTIVVGGDDTILEVLALANQTGEELMRRGEWSRLYQEQAVGATQSAIALPADFHRLIQGGAVMEGGASTSFIRGATSSDQWRLLKKSTSTQPYFFINGGSIEFYPDTTANGANVAYVSKYWVKPVTGPNKIEFTSDDDIALFSEELMVKGVVWRWRRNKGLDYQDQLAEFEADFVTELKADRGVTT